MSGGGSSASRMPSRLGPDPPAWLAGDPRSSLGSLSGIDASEPLGEGVESSRSPAPRDSVPPLPARCTRPPQTALCLPQASSFPVGNTIWPRRMPDVLVVAANSVMPVAHSNSSLLVCCPVNWHPDVPGSTPWQTLVGLLRQNKVYDKRGAHPEAGAPGGGRRRARRGPAPPAQGGRPPRRRARARRRTGTGAGWGGAPGRPSGAGPTGSSLFA